MYTDNMKTLCFIASLLAFWSSYCFGNVNNLPGNLLVPPTREWIAEIPRLSGLINDVEALKLKPRVVIGYVSEKDWAFKEFLCMMQASWRYITDLAESSFKIDLLVFSHPRWAREISSLYQLVDLEVGCPHGMFNARA